jgi:hypothetical protein
LTVRKIRTTQKLKTILSIYMMRSSTCRAFGGHKELQSEEPVQVRTSNANSERVGGELLFCCFARIYLGFPLIGSRDSRCPLTKARLQFKTERPTAPIPSPAEEDVDHQRRQ